MKKVIVVGAGFGGLSCAAKLGRAGYDVLVIEKNDVAGGRCREWKRDGFTFDMGPSWYMMPEVFDNWFESLGRKRENYYNLERLDPRYRMYFSSNEFVDVIEDLEEMKKIFEMYQKGSGARLESFLDKAKTKYDVSRDNFMYSANTSYFDLFNFNLLKHIFLLNIFGNYDKEIRSYFVHEKILKLMEWVILFVGCSPRNAPGVYSLMNWADWGTGVWYPEGGLSNVSHALKKVCEEEGVIFQFNEEVTSIVSEKGSVRNVVTEKGVYPCDVVVVNGDYAWAEMNLLDKEDRSYDVDYWESRILSPSVLCWYVGIKGTLRSLKHHTFFSDTDVNRHLEEIYTDQSWPTKPLFYVCNPSKTDATCAPENCENLFILIPVPARVEDTEQVRKKYWDYVMDKMELYEGTSIRDRIVVERSYGPNDLSADYHALGNHGFGLANTLWQTAIWRPSIRSKKVSNLWYTGCMTVPGVGLPTSLISGEVVAREILK